MGGQRERKGQPIDMQAVGSRHVIKAPTHHEVGARLDLLLEVLDLLLKVGVPADVVAQHGAVLRCSAT